MTGPLLSWALAATPIASMALVLLLGRPVIRWLREAGAGQRVREDGPQRHLEKEGTPTMGGILIIGAALAGPVIGSWPLWGALAAKQSALSVVLRSAVVAVLLAAASIGFVDDWRKIRRGRSLGLRARDKLALQFLVSAVFVLGLGWWMWSHQAGVFATLRSPLWVAGWTVFWTLAIIATSNAVNLADGLDGLAGGLCVMGFAGFALVALRLEHQGLAVLALSLAGACAGFLWYNRHPARLFMGDVGSLALGAAMAAMAARMNAPAALIGFALVPFLEMASVIIQVAWFKTTGRRVFKMSPIHHHFELIGWSERKVVTVFWLAQAASTAAVAAWYLRGANL